MAAYAADSVESQSDRGRIWCQQCSELDTAEICRRWYWVIMFKGTCATWLWDKISIPGFWKESDVAGLAGLRDLNWFVWCMTLGGTTSANDSNCSKLWSPISLNAAVYIIIMPPTKFKGSNYIRSVICGNDIHLFHSHRFQCYRSFCSSKRRRWLNQKQSWISSPRFHDVFGFLKITR